MSAVAGAGERMPADTISTNGFVVDLFRVADALDAAAFARRFTDDAVFRFGNTQPVVGADQIEDSVAGFFSQFKAMRHEIIGVWLGSWEVGDVYSVETMVVYTRHDDTVTDPIPANSTLRMQDGLIKDFRIFADISPLFTATRAEAQG
jgi:hypothetical protein